MGATDGNGGRCSPARAGAAPAGQCRDLVGPSELMALGRPDRAGPDLRLGPRLPVGAGPQDCTSSILLHRPMGLQNRHFHRRLAALSGKGLPYALPIRPTPIIHARSTPSPSTTSCMAPLVRSL